MMKAPLLATDVLKANSNTTTLAINADSGNTSKMVSADLALMTSISITKDALIQLDLPTDM